MSSVRPSRTAEAIASLFVKSCKSLPSLGASGSIQGADSYFIELPSELAIHASGQPSFLVRRKSAILCGRAPAVLYFPNRAPFSPAVLYLTLSACASEGYSSWVCVSVCVCVCVCVCPDKDKLHVCSHQPVMVPIVCI